MKNVKFRRHTVDNTGIIVLPLMDIIREIMLNCYEIRLSLAEITGSVDNVSTLSLVCYYNLSF